MMRGVRLVFIFEDSLQRAFLGAFARRAGWPRPLRDVQPPAGRGSGKAHVIDKVADEVIVLRRRRERCAIVALLDSDGKPESELRRQIDKRLANESQPLLSEEDPLLLVVHHPRLETWIRGLVEGDWSPLGKWSDKQRAGASAQARDAAVRLHECCSAPSTSFASEEFPQDLRDTCARYHACKSRHLRS